MTAAEICRDLALNPASYARARRRILAEVNDLRSVRIAVLSACTLHTFKAVLFVEAALRGLRLDWWFAPFGQLEAPILEPDGPLHRHQPDVLLLFTRLEDLLPGMMQRFVTHDATAQQSALEGLINRFRGILESYRSHSTAPVLVANFAPPAALAAGLADKGTANRPPQPKTLKHPPEDLFGLRIAKTHARSSERSAPRTNVGHARR